MVRNQTPWLKAALSVSLGLGLLAGCGTTPAAPPAAVKAPAVDPVPAAAPAEVAPAVVGPVAAEPQPAPLVTSANPPLAAQVGMTDADPALAGSAMSATTTPMAPEVAMTGIPTVTSGPVMTGTPVMAGMPMPVGAMGPTVATVPTVPVGPVGIAGPANVLVGGTAAIGGLGLGVIPPGPASFGPEGANGLVAFQSNRDTGGGARSDIFVFDAVAATVLALPGVNTFSNESNPRLSSNGQWLVYQSDETGHDDIYMFNLRNQLINTLRILNTEHSNESQADISDDGSTIVYVSDETGSDELRVYDLLAGNNFKVPVANRGLVKLTWPTISGNGAVIAYGATAPGSETDIFVYSVPDAAQLTPPFLNTAYGEYNPDLDATGEHVLFVSNRRGDEDIYAVDLRSGFTDNLVLANTPAREQEPRWLAGGNEAIIFHSDRTGEYRLYAYSLTTALLNTLPVANEIFADTQLRDTRPKLH